MTAIPSFDERGLLPADATVPIDSLRKTFLVTGEGVGSPSWDSAWRGELVDRLEVVVGRFVQAGPPEELWIDGSFVERKDRPGDIDGYFILHDPSAWPRFRRRLNELEADPIWDWNPARRRMYPGSAIPKPPFWGRYRVDLFPDFGRPSGIFDGDGNPLTFSQAFRLQRHTHEPKGILRVTWEP